MNQHNAQIDQPDFFSNLAEETYTAITPNQHRKRLGQFFTPPPIAAFMAEWIAGNPTCRTILDPAVGLGILLRALLNRPTANRFELVGYDIDLLVLQQAQALFAHCDQPQVQLLNKDYIFDDWHTRYDGIICNPPYLKFQQYKNRAASLEEFQQRLGMTLSGLTNIYTLFLLKSIHQLTNGGRAAYIVPQEFLNADYGTTIKRSILKSRTLRYVILFDSHTNVFSNALTTACILLFANDQHCESPTFIDAHSVAELAQIAQRLHDYPNARVTGKTIPYARLDPDVKWRAYYQQRNSDRYKNVVPFAAYGNIVRGIATGHNDYFTFDRKKQHAYAIPDRFLLPCITKATHASAAFFTQADFAALVQNDKRVFLLDAGDLTEPAVRRYIEQGEQLGVDTRYLTSHRKPWFAIENRPPAPILVLVFNRNGMRFVRNEAHVRNLTCFHSFYVNVRAPSQIDLLMAYLLTDVARELFNDHQREYGGGLKKFEPNDLNQANVIDLAIIDEHTGTTILRIYHEYRASVMQRQPGSNLLETLDTIFRRLLLE
jgi:adenine-specific DNA-methyltransferase